MHLMVTVIIITCDHFTDYSSGRGRKPAIILHQANEILFSEYQLLGFLDTEDSFPKWLNSEHILVK